jgi:transcriptional regulator with XRE-family HTH domain
VTVPSCATLGNVSALFGQELRRRRELLRLSRSRLETLSGVSESQIGNLETRGATPQRATVLDLAVPLRWPIDEALELAGQAPLRSDEQAMLNQPDLGHPGTARRELLRIIETLSDDQVLALLHVVRTFRAQANPAQSATGRGVRVTPGSGKIPEQRDDVTRA